MVTPAQAAVLAELRKLAEAFFLTPASRARRTAQGRRDPSAG
jgi:hypothetical protein